MRQFFSLFFVLFVAGIANAQVSGVIKCADGTPAAYTTVSIYRNEKTNLSPLKYGISDAKGKFSIDLEIKQGYWIAVRYVGYKEYRSELKEGDSFLEIQLEIDDKNNLGEVVVKSTYTGVQVRGDTIEFDTDHFKTGEEETVKDVLKKLPGMEVTDNGEVSFGGKQVDKVLVDGKDMFSSGSDGVINNLSADALKGAEILTNYRTGSIIDDFRSEDLTALNLKTDGKVKLTGRINLKGGIKDKWETKDNLLYMGDKLYLSSVVSSNNVGDAVFSFHDYIKNIVGLDNVLSSNGRVLDFSQEELSLLMPPQNVYKSINSLASLSGTYTPNTKLKIQGSLIFNASDMDAQSVSEQFYYALAANNTHNLNNQERNKFFSLNLSENYKANEKLEFSNRTHFSATSLNTEDSLSEHGLKDMFSFENSDLKKTALQDELAINFKTSRGLLSAHVIMSNTHRNYSYALQTDGNILPVTYEQISATSYALNTNRRINDFKLSPDVTFAYHLTKKLVLQTTFVFDYNENTFKYKENTASVEENLKWNNYTLKLLLSKNLGFLRFRLGSDIRNSNWSTSIASLKSSSQWDLLPNASLTLSFSTSHELTLSASVENSPIEMEYLHRDTIINGYNSLYDGSLIEKPFAKTKSANIHYSIFDMYTNTMFFVAGGWNDSEVTLSHVLQNNTIVSESVYDNDGHTTAKYLTANLSKGLGFIPVDAKLTGSVSHTKSKTFLNNNEDEMQSLTYSANLGFTSRMKTVLNFELFGYYSGSEYEYSVSDISNSMYEKGINAGVVFVYKNLVGNVRAKKSFLDNESYGRDYLDLSFRVEYRIKRWRLHISGNNILNIKDMDWTEISVNSFYSSTVLFRKIPGNILFGVSYRF